MKQDELDRILVSEEQVEPPATFTESVMDRIRLKDRPFPWILFLALLAAAAIPVVAFFPSTAVFQAEEAVFRQIGQFLTSGMDETLVNALLMTALSLSGTLFLVWVSFRVAGAGR